MNGEKGFLSLTAVVVIIIFALLSATLVSMFIRASTSTNNLKAIAQAAALAESGLEQGRANLTEPVLANRQSCGALANLTSLATGSFTVTPASGLNPRYAFATLAGSIASTGIPAAISVNDGSVFAAGGGRVLIGKEVIQYQRVNGNALTGISRAQDGSSSTTHPAGTLVSQYQCNIASTGNAPANTPLATREYQQGLQQPVVFAVGNGGATLRWNSDASELNWAAMASPGYAYNAVSMLNYHQGWAVADRTFFFIFPLWTLAQLDGNSWSSVTQFDFNAQDLHGVDTTSEYEAWAVGDRGSGDSFTILNWTRNSGGWCALPCNGRSINESGTDDDERYLYAVKTIDYSGDGFADVGYAVGGESGTTTGNRNNAIIMAYNGSTWRNLPLPTGPRNRIGQLYGVDIVANGGNPPRDVYFVGKDSRKRNNSDGKILRYRDGSWSVITIDNVIMRAVAVIDTNGDGLADFGIAVGDNGSVYGFDTNFSVSGSAVITGQDLRAVTINSSTDAWIAGENGVIFHYDGTSINLTASGGNDINGIRGISAKQSPVSSWQDTIN